MERKWRLALLVVGAMACYLVALLWYFLEWTMTYEVTVATEDQAQASRLYNPLPGPLAHFQFPSAYLSNGTLTDCAQDASGPYVATVVGTVVVQADGSLYFPTASDGLDFRMGLPDYFTVFARVKQGVAGGKVFTSTSDATWYLGWGPSGVGLSVFNSVSVGSVANVTATDWNIVGVRNG